MPARGRITERGAAVSIVIRNEPHWQKTEMLEAEHRLLAMPTWLRESFEFLGVPARATLADARMRYRELARKYHPDATGSTELMARLNEAWAKVEAFFSGRTDSLR